MAINKSVGHMYPWADTWNPIRGECPHQCSYCYVPHTRAGHLYAGEMHLAKGAFKQSLRSDKILFVGSMIDMWLAPPPMIRQVLVYCRYYPDNTYLFQSKNPFRMIGWTFPPKTIVGTTIETDDPRFIEQERCELGYPDSLPPYPGERAVALAYLKRWQGLRTMVSIEPIMAFSLFRMVPLIKICEPEFVSIGADSKGSRLKEPNATEVRFLIKELEKFTEVRVKPNLTRILENRGGIL